MSDLTGACNVRRRWEHSVSSGPIRLVTNAIAGKHGFT